MNNTEQFTQNIATLVKGITQGTTTRGMEVGQGSGNTGENQPQIKIVATNVEIPVGYPVNPTTGLEEEPRNTNMIIPIAEPPRVERPQFEQPRMESPRVEQPRFEQPRTEPPRVEQL